ncbi:MAG TPA: N-acetyl-gamma-glutamyl-phosphate reductase [Acidobacteriota bacterium]|nr:N-acetyl-gamma-glutamyl-phosphate reductase [Acidobacteriota bacterium]
MEGRALGAAAKASRKLRVAIAGGSGYGGGELLRILLLHPQAEVCLVSSERRAGQPVEEAHPNLSGLTELAFRSLDESIDWHGLDLLFLALPHGRSAQVVPELPADLPLIDLAGDFRLRDPEEARAHYRHETDAALLDSFVYGLSEINAAAIASARRVANPGCFATAVGLALYPLVSAGLIEDRVVADAKTGSSGSGAQARETTHHPRRSNSFFAYKSFRHQHLPEIRQLLRQADPEWDGGPLLQTHSAPMVRGIFASLYCLLKEDVQADRAQAQVETAFDELYRGQPFIRIRSHSPDVNWVKNTNCADLSWVTEGRELIVFSAIDNLVKGAAGQAVQNMNLMFGLPQTAGLVFTGSHP